MDSEERVKLGVQASIIGIVSNVLLTVVKGIIGFIAGSTAMVADALHSASDVLSSVVVMVGLKLANRPPDADHHYGHGKIESVAAKILAIILIITGIAVGWSALQIIAQPEISIPGQSALWAALISILVKEALFHYTVKVGKKIKSNAVIADAWHHRSDALSSVAALVGIGGALLGYPILDPIAGLIVALMILKMGGSIYWQSIKELLDTAPDREIMYQIKEVTIHTSGVRSVHDIKARHHGPKILVDMIICVRKDLNIEEAHDVAVQVKINLKEEITDIEDVLIHINPCYRKVSELGNNCDRCEHPHRGHSVGHRG